MINKNNKKLNDNKKSLGQGTNVLKKHYFLFESIPIKLIFIALLVLISYFPALRSGYIWDDNALTENLVIRTNDGLLKIWFSPSEILQESHYWPLTYTTFWIEYRFWGLNPFGYHLVNVLIHILNAILLFLILRKLSVPVAWLASAIFALHPVHIESVAWVIERKDVLSGMFYLLSFLMFIHFNENKKWGIYALSLLFFICAMLSKSITVSLPLALLLYLYWKSDKIKKSDLLQLIPFLIIAIILAFFDVRFAQQAEDLKLPFSFIDRILIATRAVWFYAWKVLLPINLIPIYPRWEIDARAIWQYLFPLLLIATFILLWLKRKQFGKAPLVLVLYFVVTLGPILGFFDYSYMLHSYVADRFQYLASIGLIILVSSFILKIFRILYNYQKRILYIIIGLLLLVLGILTFQHTKIYKDTRTLFEYTISKNPEAYGAYNALGNFLLEQGKAENAIVYYSKALQIEPNYAQASYNMGLSLDKLGRFQEAIQYYLNTIEISPHFIKAYNNLGNAKFRQGEIEDAEAYYLKALEINPKFADAHFNLGNILNQNGKIDEAISHYLQAIQINPYFVQPYVNLGIVLANQGKVDKAITYFSKAIQIDPNFPDAYYNLGISLLQKNKLDEAITQFAKVIEITPNDADAHYNLGNICMKQGNVQQAVIHYKKALQIRPDWKEVENLLLHTPSASQKPISRREY